MNFAVQFFANFVNDGLQAQETWRSFNDSEEYDPFWQSAEVPPKPDCSFHMGRRSTLICPERLKDFGAEEYLNGDMKVFETSISEAPEVQLLSTPKPAVKKSGESKTAAKAAPEHLRFEDISAAAFKLQQAGIQKTPCTYCTLLQDQQRKGVIVATDCSFSMAVAYHAVELRIPVFVIMPACCSPPTARDSISHARHLARENGYLCLEEDDSAVYLAGLGTVGLEIYEQVPKLDAVIVPAGGHCGLLAGTAAAIKHLNPRISDGVELEDFPLLLQSLKTDSPIKDLYCNPNKKLYREETLSKTFKNLNYSKI
uniref:L-serine deaminase n=1 Tax=Sinocyclocheilus rhinocerous TaxID=307959 RepID=A0A673ICG5_9TELE